MKKEMDLVERLHQIAELSNGQPISIKILVRVLAKKGYATLIVLFSLPFCLPIQIPGLSTPFGIALMFIGLRIAFGNVVWLPEWILNKTIPFSVFKKIANWIEWFLRKLKFIKPRAIAFVQNPYSQIFHGLLVAMLGFFLALPLPIPFTNLLSAIPLVLIGFALMENDGLVLGIAYILSTFCFLFFIGLYFLGETGLKALLQHL